MLAAAISIVLMLGAQPERHAPCSRVPDQKVAHIIRCTAKRFGIDPDYAIGVARCESSLNPRAVGGTNDRYYGLFQHRLDLWQGRWEWVGVHPRWRVANDPLDPHANALVTMRMAKAVGWGPWECA